MRKVTYGGACSADGFITGPDEAIDWLRMSKDVEAIIKQSWRGVDTMLMGRKTFEFGQKFQAQGSRGESEQETGGGPATPGITSYVFSRTLDDVELRSRLSPGQSAPVLVRDDAAGFVRALKAKPGGDIIVMGGGELGTALIEAGLVDEIGFSIHPLLLGGGTPAFQPMGRRVELELIEARAIAEGCVFVRWSVVN